MDNYKNARSENKVPGFRFVPTKYYFKYPSILYIVRQQ